MEIRPRVSECNAIHQVITPVQELMTIEYLDCPERVNESLCVNPQLELEVSNTVNQLFINKYIKKRKDEKVNTNCEMIISLTHEQPIRFRARRMPEAVKRSYKSYWTI